MSTPPPASPGTPPSTPVSGPSSGPDLPQGQERGGPSHAPRSGAHRPRRPLWHDIAPTLVVLVAVIAVVIGVFAVKDSILGSSSTSSSGTTVPNDDDDQGPAPTAPTSTSPTTSPTSSSPSSTASAPTVDKSVRVHVWNATSRSGLAAGAAQKLSGKGWKASPAGNQSGYGGSTTVYYTKASLRATAKAVAKSLGGYPVKLGTAYGSSGVVIVLGSDYQA